MHPKVSNGFSHSYPKLLFRSLALGEKGEKSVFNRKGEEKSCSFIRSLRGVSHLTPTNLSYTIIISIHFTIKQKKGNKKGRKELLMEQLLFLMFHSPSFGYIGTRLFHEFENKNSLSMQSDIFLFCHF